MVRQSEGCATRPTTAALLKLLYAIVRMLFELSHVRGASISTMVYNLAWIFS